ncbi:hypothetical protein Tsubulata_020709 [Turnera subulata]|uniref:RING-type E3 ubiquitin transferase n=1 Tax=Turnera subulata TaxID=218843 RepID=A0A9Q0F3V7_9ROSI|nr:hypothetical protein Tsubulata_020709 [Turnera subulata]
MSSVGIGVLAVDEEDRALVSYIIDGMLQVDEYVARRAQERFLSHPSPMFFSDSCAIAARRIVDRIIRGLLAEGQEEGVKIGMLLRYLDISYIIDFAALSILYDVHTSKLEDVEIKEPESICAVCLDELPMEYEAKRMPCSHLYHEKCISDWLWKSGTCPLCRYKLLNPNGLHPPFLSDPHIESTN